MRAALGMSGLKVVLQSPSYVTAAPLGPAEQDSALTAGHRAVTGLLPPADDIPDRESQTSEPRLSRGPWHGHHGFLATAAYSGISGTDAGSPGSGRHSGTVTRPGSTSSRAARKPATASCGRSRTRWAA